MKIEFKDLTYKVSSGYKCGCEVKKTILKSINGEFRSCELTAIIGPSGSGKTSLLNVLSGFTSDNVKGIIKVNGEILKSSTHMRHATYIMQEDSLFPLLTVEEAMKFAMKFKTGNKQNKSEKIMNILSTLGLDHELHSFVGDLSGGQKRRLSIAVELVNDPPIVFLDEPTTGLDSLSAVQCINFLMKLSKQGRAIVCTIHQPSTSMFDLFDHVFALAEGEVIYQGSSQNLISFLESVNMPCPETYSPNDYLLEIASNDYGNMNNCLNEKINNGLNFDYCKSAINDCDENHNIPPKCHSIFEPLKIDSYALPVLDQFLLLMKRNFVFMSRNKFFYSLRVFMHIFVAIMLGLIYADITNDASFILNIYRFTSCSAVFCAYAGFYSLMVRFPLEHKTIKREHFNRLIIGGALMAIWQLSAFYRFLTFYRWYSSTPYYLSLVLSDFPVVLISSTLFTIISYMMTNQPLEMFRFMNFILISAMSSFSAQAHGILFGALFDLNTALIAAALLTGGHALASGTLFFFKDISRGFQWVFDFVYLKHSIDASAVIVLGFDRPKFHCKDMYCHFQSPKKFLASIGIEENLSRAFTNMTVTLLIVHLLSFFVMRHRLRT